MVGLSPLPDALCYSISRRFLLTAPLIPSTLVTEVTEQRGDHLCGLEWLIDVVPRDRIELSTPAFSGLK
ncbi:MAG: hypothetical protein OEY77_02740, partial [Nitrospira sp.]|nr:hypothetical protein [Nitrospira sp.]